MNIETKAKAKTVVNADVKIGGDGEVAGLINVTDDGYNAYAVRAQYQSKGEAEYTKDYLNQKRWTASKTEFQNIKELDKPVTQIHEVTISDHASLAGDAIYINPIITGQMKQNPFKEATRIYPVDYGAATEQVYMCKIIVPDGFKVDELPQSKVLALPQNAGRYMYNITQTGNVINLTSIFTINRSIFTQAEYPNLREFYNQVVAKQAEQVVLKKN
jgi:hypothetical protein